MSADILLNPNKSASQEAASPSSSKSAEQKTAPSLFDSILSEAKNNAEHQDKSDNKTAEKRHGSEESKTESKNSDPKKQINDESKVQENEKEISKTTQRMGQTPNEKSNDTLDEVSKKLVDIVTKKAKDDRQNPKDQSNVKETGKELIKSDIKKDPDSKVEEIKTKTQNHSSQKTEKEDNPEKINKSDLKADIKDSKVKVVEESPLKETAKTEKTDKAEIKEEIKDPKSKVEDIKIKLDDKSSDKAEKTDKAEIKEEIKDPKSKVEDTKTKLNDNSSEKTEKSAKVEKEDIKDPKSEVEDIKTKLNDNSSEETEKSAKVEKEDIKDPKVKADEIKTKINDNSTQKTEKVQKQENPVKPQKEDKTEIKEDIKDPKLKADELKINSKEAPVEQITETAKANKVSEKTETKTVVSTKSPEKYTVNSGYDETNPVENKENKTVLKNDESNLKSSSNLADLADETKTNQQMKDPFLANMFLSSQRKLKETTSQEQLKNAKQNIHDNKNMESVSKSASMLDLNPEEVEIETEKSSKGSEDLKRNPLLDEKNDKSKTIMGSNNRLLDRMFLEKHITEKVLTQNSMQKENISLQKAASLTTAAAVNKEPSELTTKETAVTIQVPQNIVETIQNKIVGAQQRMGSFMSEVARNMYENYKPPVTAFRVSLNPANLGSIAIVMKANKSDNSLSVSMSMSNSSTMEAFADNKTALQNALSRNMNDGSNISLDFGMQNQNNQSENSFGQQNSNNKKDSNDHNSPDNRVVEEELAEEVLEDQTYM
jgi:hypothetical protein